MFVHVLAGVILLLSAGLVYLGALTRPRTWEEVVAGSVQVVVGADGVFMVLRHYLV